MYWCFSIHLRAHTLKCKDTDWTISKLHLNTLKCFLHRAWQYLKASSSADSSNQY